MAAIDSTNEAVEPNEPNELQKLGPEFVQAVDTAKNEIASEKRKKRPRRPKKVSGAEGVADVRNSPPKPNGGGGKGKKSDAKIAEELKAEAAPVPEVLNRQNAVPLNPRISDRFRINPKSITIGTHRELLSLPVRAPNRFENFRTHPSLYMDVMIIRPKDSQETYVIDTCMHAVLRRWIVPATIRLTITSDEAHIVWPLRFATDDEKDFAAWSSARSIAEDAETEWCSLIWNRPQMAYDKGTADIAFDEPVWNEFTTDPDAIDKMIAKMKDNFVEDMSHPLVKRLGLQAKKEADAAANNKKDPKK